MYPTIIGISLGLAVILAIGILKHLDKTLMYGLILTGIGFLYVGYVWQDWPALILNAIQAIVFLLIAYYGTKKSINILAAGYFLHGCWDISYSFFSDPGLIPPHYDLFCLSVDFTMGAYILIFKNHFSQKKLMQAGI
ncbi:MAG: hypothetical protein JWP81_469 [Ferruginibacter sp.]|nr:hypothetical protein [Ferruginibacter sp.]